jgi:glutamyl-tRNA synthetase
MSDVRVRIAPSNTGSDVHIGNVRTALFNYLFAKQHKGTFVFRIENSDTVRSKDEYADAIAESLNWLGLTPDEGYKCANQQHGPYMQTDKLERYKQVADQLIASGHAYRCYCTAEELAAQKLANKDAKGFSKYKGVCRDRKDQPSDRDYVVRFKAPTDGEVVLDDKVFGKIVMPNKENYDFVIMRSNGIPLYNFGCVVDDIDQKITHVIRGRDHLVNCVPQILLYQALGAPLPVFAHLPMMLNQKGEKLSKRDGAVTIREYKNAGYSPNAILNYLAKFGWGMKNKEIFTLDELIENFSLEACGRGDGKFDPVKFASINASHLKDEKLTSDDDYTNYLKPIVDAKAIGDFSQEALKPFVSVVRTRAKTFIEACDLAEPMLRSEVQTPPELMQKTFTTKNASYLQSINDVLATLADWNKDSVRASIQNWLQGENLALKDVGGALRIALLGTPNSPEIFDVMGILGKDKSLSRLGHTLNQLKTHEYQ